MTNNFKQWSVKYRPKSLTTFIENEYAKSQIQHIIDNQDTHAILLYGDSGCGKTSLARILANNLTNVPSDITEKNISSERDIGTIRSLISASKYLPSGGYKIFILDEVHALLGQSQSAILKTIEEPEHDRVVWILCTDRPYMLSPQLLNRLYKIEVKKPSEIGLAKYLFSVVKKENVLEKFNTKQKQRIAKEVATASSCVPREAIQLLKRMVDSSDKFESFKDLVISGIRKQTEDSIDKTALQVLLSIYSSEKEASFRVEFLINQVHEKDLWGLVTRLCDINVQLMNLSAGVRSKASYYYEKELKGKGALPDTYIAACVQSDLVKIKNGLLTLNTSLDQFVVPELVKILFNYSAEKK